MEPIDVEFRFKNIDGTWRYLNSNGSDQSNNPAIGGIVVNTRDITDRVEAEKALKASERNFRQIFEHMKERLYRTTLDGKILLVNPSLVKMVGCESAQELEGERVDELPYWQKYDRQQFLHEISANEWVTDFQSIWITRDGRELQILENAHAVKDENGGILYYEGTVADITQEKVLEQQLIESQKLESLG